MLPSKTKSGLMETPLNKSTPATPRVAKLGRTPSRSEKDSHSPLQSSRLSVDRSPRSVDSKPTVDHRSAKINTTPDKHGRAVKGSDLQEQLSAAQEDLKKAKDRLVSVEKEKARALEELSEAKRQAEEANEKLAEAFTALDKAEESAEIEKFRTVELEQAGIEASQQREELWQKEMDTVRNQHALDVSALLSTTQELQRVKQELMMTTEAKNTALSHAGDAMKIAEIHAEKVEILSGEVNRLKALLASKMENKANEASQQIKKLNSEVDALRCELEGAKEAELKVLEMESLVLDLRIEVTDLKTAESEATSMVDEWKKKVELLELRVEETVLSERSASESLALTVKELEECNASLQDAVSEIASLKGKVESLEMEIARHKEDLDESDHLLQMAKQEVSEMEKTIEVLKSEIQSTEEEKMKALDNEKQSAANLQSLLEEKDKILNELENSREEVEHSKKAMDGLASALHEVSTEARESKERLLTKQAEVADAKEQIDELNVALKSTEEKYETMLDNAKDEIICLEADVERFEMEAENSKSEWNRKELSFMTSLKKTEEEWAVIKEQMDVVVGKLVGAESEAAVSKEEAVLLLAKVKEAELEVASASEATEEARGESLRLKEMLLDKENELQSITQENDDLRTREEAALEKIKELSGLLEEAMDKKEEYGELANSEKDYDEPDKAVELSDAAGGETDEHKHNLEASPRESRDLGLEDHKPEVNGNGKAEHKEPVMVDSKKWESCKVVDKGFSPEREPEPESLDDEMDSKTDAESLYQMNGSSLDNTGNSGISPNKEQQHKKKKPLLRKFGSLLKKKNNQK